MLQYEWFSSAKRESILRHESVRWLGSQSESLLSFWRISPWRNFMLGKAQTIPALAGQSLLMATQICSCFWRERKQLMWPVTKLTQRDSSFVLAKLKQTLDYTTWEMLADVIKVFCFFFFFFCLRCWMKGPCLHRFSAYLLYWCSFCCS